MAKLDTGNRMRRRGLSGVMLIALFSCAGPQPPREKLASPYPLDRVRAAVALADAGDAGAVDRLIGLLEDPDPGVRLYTILALERLCGRTYGYSYHSPEPERAAAVARWRAARERDEVVVRPAVRSERTGSGETAAYGGSTISGSPGERLDADTR
jgi:hypothetical protein